MTTTKRLVKRFENDPKMLRKKFKTAWKSLKNAPEIKCSRLGLLLRIVLSVLKFSDNKINMEFDTLTLHVAVG